MTQNPVPGLDLMPRASRGKRIGIIGGGPGGLSAALALSQAGFDVKVFERDHTTQALGGAILLNAIGIHILRGYGVVVDDLFTAGTSRFRRYDGHERVLWKTDPHLLRDAGVHGWISGMMRSEVYERMLAQVPEGMICNNHKLDHYVENEHTVTVHFTNGNRYECDLVVGADGINSKVRQQRWGPSELKHLGIAVWLGWAEFDGASRDEMILHHNDLYQFGFAPLRFQNKNCFEWWFVEPCTENQSKPADVKSYIKTRLRDFAYPVHDILDATDPDEALFRWVVKYRDPLKQWSKGRITILGDAAHPTSPYAGYGAGMAIEDGFFLGKLLAGCDLADEPSLRRGLDAYDGQRVKYTNQVVSFARTLGWTFHNAPRPVRKLRDFFLDHTKIPDKQISKGYTEDAQKLLRAILDAENMKTQLR